MKLSVILPTYNVEKYLSKCINSLINQPLDDVEYIFVDDCSPDNSKDIILAFAEKDKRIRYIKNEKNMGVGHGRNFGYEQSSGEYIAFLDPDDFVDNNMYYHLYQVAKKYNADIVECKTIKVYEEDSIYQNPKHSNLNAISQKDPIKNYVGDDIVMHIEHGLVHSIWCKIYKRDIIKDVRFPLNGFTDDATFNFKVMANAKSLYYVDMGLYYYLQRDGGWTKKEIKSETLIGVRDNIISIRDYLVINQKYEALKEAYFEMIAKFFVTCIKTLGGYSSSPHQQIKFTIDLFCNDEITDIKTLKTYLDRYYPFYLNYLSKVYKNIGKQEYQELCNILQVTNFDKFTNPIKSVKRVIQYVGDRGIVWTTKSMIQIIASTKR